MPTISSESGEKEAILQAAELMLVAARTAPKTAGIDDVLTSIVYGRRKKPSLKRWRILEGNGISKDFTETQKTLETPKLLS